MPRIGLNQDCKTEPVIATSQVCDCKVKSLWLQSHKKAGANATNKLLNSYDL